MALRTFHLWANHSSRVMSNNSKVRRYVVEIGPAMLY